MTSRPLFAFRVLPLALVTGAAGWADAAQVVGVSVLDRDYLVVHVLDGEVIHENPDEDVIRYTPELSTSAAGQTTSWTLRSSDDASYGGAGQHPAGVSRKTKLSGHAQMEWVGSDYRYEYTYQHWLYLRLPSSLQQGASYTLDIDSGTNCDSGSEPFTFDVYTSRSEAVHVNLVGYAPDAPHKAADLYHWMGDGGGRDYSSFEGNTVYVYDVGAGTAEPAGQVAFWSSGGSDVGGYDLVRTNVWSADFSGFTTPGTYRLVIDGVGCSQDFSIAPDVYADPFAVSVRGFFYMRIGQEDVGLVPVPRTPLYIPGTDPANTTVYLTTMHPWHPQWSSFAGGDKWDARDEWAAFRQAGNPTNPEAWGGHSDAADWDRHLGHVSIIYDMLLPYILTDGAIGDDDTGIAESGNGIPDLLDEARYEVDFWLRLRDGDGYSHGLNNPNGDNVFYQAGATAMAAWANAANCAMLADAFRIAGQTSLMEQYRDAAVAAYGHASGLGDQMLDTTQGVGDCSIRGRDFKLTAAAYLYNVTGDAAYEAVIDAESVCSGGTADLEDGSRNQVWATAAYLMTPRTVGYPTLWDNMKASVIAQARSEETDNIDWRPSRRATDGRTGYFRTAQNVHRTLIAHAITDDPSDKDRFYKALALEADWGLGRNPLNMLQMTTAHTPLESRRSCEHVYTSGRHDGVPGVHPGHTPYLNLDDWAPGMTMGTPSRLYQDSYPSDFRSNWPIGEAYFDTPWVWAYSEFTPQQTMRGKMALYGYLYGLSGGSSAGGAGGTGGAGGAGGAGGTAGAGAAAGVGASSGAAGTSGTGGAPPILTGGAGGAAAAGGTIEPGPTCPAPLSLCNGWCVDLASDPLNCGSCGAACAAGEVCSMGVCTSSCAAGLTQCGQACVDLNSDILNCGACGAYCQPGQTCSGGICVGTPTGTGSPAQPAIPTSQEEESSGGCGCRLGGPSRAGWPAAGLAGLVAALGLGRRRRRPR